MLGKMHMHGNIVEWCRDWYHARLPGGTDPDLHDAKATAALNRTGDYSRSRRGSASSRRSETRSASASSSDCARA